MKGKRIMVTAILVTLMTMIFGFHVASVRAAPPSIPHAFYGPLTIDDKPAPAGTRVEARGEGVKLDITGNPIVTTEAGYYGSPESLGPKLVVQGEITEGTNISFYVNGDFTGQTWPWHSGDITRLDLAAVSTIDSTQFPKNYHTLVTSTSETEQMKPTESEPSANWLLIVGIIAVCTLVVAVLFIFILRPTDWEWLDGKTGSSRRSSDKEGESG